MKKLISYIPSILTLILIYYLSLNIDSIAERERQERIKYWEKQRFVKIEEISPTTSVYVDKTTLIEYVVSCERTSIYKPTMFVAVRYDENGQPKKFKKTLDNPFRIKYNNNR